MAEKIQFPSPNMTLFFFVEEDYFKIDSSTTAISSAVSPYNPYTSESICRSVDSISSKEEHSWPRFCPVLSVQKKQEMEKEC
jgi:hypothetical protein